jgi:hypothetical protein
MRRVVVRVDESGAGWTVSVRTAEGEAVVAPYEMNAVGLPGRRVPGVPAARRPADGEPHAGLCAGDADRITALLDRLHTGRPASDDVSTYGRWLFECLLSPAWQAIQQDCDVIRDRAVEIALRWPSEASDLHRLVWEAMRDPVAPLAAHRVGVVAITRLVPTNPPPEHTITGVPRVLFASSVRVSDPTIRPGAMFMGLLRGFDADGRCRARVVQGVSADSLATACAAFQPHVVHLVAHGVQLDDGRGALMLQGDGGVEQEADATALTAALTAGGNRPMAVILSACNTASGGESTEDPTDASPLAAQLVAAGVPVVSAMAGEVSESACRLYTRSLANALHEGKPIAVASAHGRRAALVAEAAPSRNIDWALPALYLAADLDPARALIDPTRANALVDRANNLDLRREPVFIGREDILEVADQVVDPAFGAGVVAVLSRQSTAKLGGTRLLREIGWRLLRDGHVPVLLGPYAAKTEPKSAREFVFAVLCQFVKITEKLGLAPFVPAVLGDDLPAAEEAALVADVAAAQPARARSLVRKALYAFQHRGAPLDAASVRDLLADDFAELTRLAHGLGEPFGAHTRAILLCDDVHEWEPPGATGLDTTALGCLLGMLDASGLGRTGQSVPVIFTGGLEPDTQLTTWRAKSRPGIRVLEFGELAADEAVLGFQWVLLHPWTTRPDTDRELYGTIYTTGPAGLLEWERTLRKVGPRPTHVEDRLYDAVYYTEGTACVRNDDEQALRDYAVKHPEYRL